MKNCLIYAKLLLCLFYGKELMMLSIVELLRAEEDSEVILSKHNLSYGELVKVFGILKENPNLTHLDLSHNTSVSVDLIIELFKANDQIESLVLNRCLLSSSEIEELLEAIPRFAPSLQKLSLQDNRINSVTVVNLQEFEKEFPNIKLEFSTTYTYDPKDVYASSLEDSEVIHRNRLI